MQNEFACTLVYTQSLKLKCMSRQMYKKMTLGKSTSAERWWCRPVVNCTFTTPRSICGTNIRMTSSSILENTETTFAEAVSSSIAWTILLTSWMTPETMPAWKTSRTAIQTEQEIIEEIPFSWLFQSYSTAQPALMSFLWERGLEAQLNSRCRLQFLESQRESICTHISGCSP